MSVLLKNASSCFGFQFGTDILRDLATLLAVGTQECDETTLKSRLRTFECLVFLSPGFFSEGSI